MATTHDNKEAAQKVADEFNEKFLGAGYAVTYIGQPYAAFAKVPRGGYYVVDPWGKIL
jgi:hypothetical protein